MNSAMNLPSVTHAYLKIVSIEGAVLTTPSCVIVNIQGFDIDEAVKDTEQYSALITAISEAQGAKIASVNSEGNNIIITYADGDTVKLCFEDYAGEKGVSVALENLEGEEYLDALLSRYGDQDHIGFCWDSGHDHCYPHQTDFLESYGSLLIMTHLNDNWGLRDPDGKPSGNDDLHFLPYDGKIDWQHCLQKLANAKKQDVLNFELKIRSHSQNPADQPYAKLPLEDFIRMAGQRGCQVAQMYDMILNA
jgi:hypothetical protein